MEALPALKEAEEALSNLLFAIEMFKSCEICRYSQA